MKKKTFQGNALQTLILFRRGDEVLMGKKRRDLAAGQWTFPGGKATASDLNFEACARREGKQETGLHANSLRYVGLITGIKSDSFFACPSVFVAVFDTFDFVGTVTASEEFESLEWIPINRLHLMSMDQYDQHWVHEVLKNNKRFIASRIIDPKQQGSLGLLKIIETHPL